MVLLVVINMASSKQEGLGLSFHVGASKCKCYVVSSLYVSLVMNLKPVAELVCCVCWNSVQLTGHAELLVMSVTVIKQISLKLVGAPGQRRAFDLYDLQSGASCQYFLSQMKNRQPALSTSLHYSHSYTLRKCKARVHLVFICLFIRWDNREITCGGLWRLSVWGDVTISLSHHSVNVSET